VTLGHQNAIMMLLSTRRADESIKRELEKMKGRLS